MVIGWSLSELLLRRIAWNGVASVPELAGRDRGAVDEGVELRPGDLRVQAQSQTAIGAGDDAIAADHARVANEAIGHHLRMLDQVRRVADDAGNQDLVVGQLRRLPDLPFV